MTKPGSLNAGIGDPYFYEWTVGQKKILDMLNPDNNIRSVVLQKSGFTGIDDVVVNYSDGSTECIQVKNTRTGTSLTFNDLVYAEKDEDPLLKQLANAWAEAEKENPKLKVVLTSNRRIGLKEAKKKDDTKLPSLQEFWTSLKQQLKDVTSAGDLKFDPKFNDAVKDFRECLSELTPEKQFQFLSNFDFDCDAPDLRKLEVTLAENISKTFGVPPEAASRIFGILDHSLRRWVTSHRETEEISPEIVLLELSRNQSDNIGDHEISPPAPFFPSRSKFLETLKKTLQDTKAKITFLYGVPGSGKTSLISSLANHNRPVVDLRFHAFKPIAPDSKLVSADTSVICSPRALWGDLLNQIRKLLRGKLAKYKVPIINDFLTTDDLRGHFLRLAADYSRETAKRIIIAIDGIDHAARAGIDGKKLLNSLVGPDQVPDGVHFIIAGQPSQSYGEYPFWLKTENTDVERIEVPLLELEDIIVLCEDHEISFPGCPIEAIAKLIMLKSEGNTLPAVFAAFEAKQCRSYEESEARLARSQLTGKLGLYYDNIWSKLAASLGENSETKQVRIAASLCLLSKKTSSIDLAKAYSDLKISESYWTEFLTILYPMVIKDAQGYRVLHNDVRIFLNSFLTSKKDLFSDSANKLIKFIKEDDAFALSRHADLGNLLIASGESEKILDFVSPKFVSEGWTLGRQHSETAYFLKLAMNEATKIGDWDVIHSVLIAIDSLRQLIRVTHVSEYKDYGFEHLRENISDSLILSVEKYVLNSKEWSVDLLNELFSGIEDLYKRKSIPRARALFNRWFEKFDILDLLDIFSKEELYNHSNEFSGSFRSLIVKFGYWSSLLDSKCFVYYFDDDNENEKWILAALASGRLQGAAVQSQYIWARQLQRAPYWFPDILEEIADYLFKEKKWGHLRLLYKRFPMASLGPRLQVKLTAYLILAEEPNMDELFENLITNWKTLTKDGPTRTDEQELYFWIAFSKGFIEHTRPLLGITEEIQNDYFSGHRDDRKKEAFARVVYSAALIGQVYKAKRKNASLTHFEKDLKRSFNAIVSIYDLKQTVFLHNVGIAVEQLLYGFTYLTNSLSDNFRNEFKYAMLNLATKRPAAGQLRPLWAYLAQENEIKILEDYYEHYFSENGIAWQDDIYGRLSLVEKFKPLALDLKWETKVVETDRRLAQKTIGFDNHKDYVMNQPLQWFKDANRAKQEILDPVIIKLLAINEVADDLGDNRLSFEVHTEILFELIKQGPVSLWRYLSLYSLKDQKRWFDLDTLSFFHALIRALEVANFSDDDLLSIWCLCIGGLSCDNSEDQAVIEDLRKALLAAAERSKRSNLFIEKMKELGKTEFTLKGRDYSRETWWFGRGTDMEVEKIISDIQSSDFETQIESILENVSSDNRSESYRALSALIEKARESGSPISEKLAATIFSRSLKISYGYSWFMDGLGDLILSLSPYIKSDEVFHKLLQETIDKIDEKCGDDVHMWVDTISNNVDQLCRHRALSREPAQLVRGLTRWLDLLEYWALSSESGQIKSPDFDPRMTIQPQSWSDFAVVYLSLLVSSTMTEQMFTALRGLWALTKVDSSALKQLPQLYAISRGDVRMRLLYLCERIGAEAPDAYQWIQPIVDAAFDSDQLGENLQAWVTINAFARASGRPPVPWKYSRVTKKYDDLKATAAIIMKPERFGSRALSSGFSAIETLLKHLSMFIEIDLDELASKASAIKEVTKENISIPCDFAVSRLTRGMRVTPQSEIVSLYHTIGDYILEMEMNDALAEVLSTSLLKSDDPFLILDTSQNLPKEEIDWPVSDDLKNLLASGGGNYLIQSALNKVAHFGIKAGFEIFAAYVSSYTSDRDLEYFSAYGPEKNALVVKIPPIPSSFNGRLFTLSFATIRHPIANPNSKWLAWRTGGLTEFSNAQLMPATFVIEYLELTASKNDPRIWLNKKGEIVLELEQRSGPMRNEILGPYFRQPKLQRWIIESSALKNLLKGRNLEMRNWLESWDFERP